MKHSTIEARYTFLFHVTPKISRYAAEITESNLQIRVRCGGMKDDGIVFASTPKLLIWFASSGGLSLHSRPETYSSHHIESL